MIVFPPREAYDEQQGEVRFPVSVIGKTVWCRVTVSGLVSSHGPAEGRDAVLALFGANRADIEARIRRKLLQGQYEPDGTILLRDAELASS